MFQPAQPRHPTSGRRSDPGRRDPSRRNVRQNQETQLFSFPRTPGVTTDFRTRWLPATEMYSLRLLDPRSWKSGIGNSGAPSKGNGEEFLASS